MTHDPLCPAYQHAEEHFDDYWCGDRCKAPCQCDLIREVRDAERLTRRPAELTRLAQKMGLIP